jgi:hypothetical protein
MVGDELFDAFLSITSPCLPFFFAKLLSIKTSHKGRAWIFQEVLTDCICLEPHQVVTMHLWWSVNLLLGVF